MKIIIKDFEFKGQYFDHYECDLPQVKAIDEEFEERIVDYIKESLILFLEEKGS